MPHVGTDHAAHAPLSRHCADQQDQQTHIAVSESANLLTNRCCPHKSNANSPEAATTDALHSVCCDCRQTANSVSSDDVNCLHANTHTINSRSSRSNCSASYCASSITASTLTAGSSCPECGAPRNTAKSSAGFGAADNDDSLSLSSSDSESESPLSRSRPPQSLPVPHDTEDGIMLRYSFKGFPPELYSPKKEFIYTRPLVEKQLVLKKTCEWWLYRNKCSNMPTHWKQNIFLLTTCVLVLLGLVTYLCWPTVTYTRTTPANTSLTLPVKTVSSYTELPTTYRNDIPEIQTQYINHSFIGDEEWSGEAMEDDIDDINNSIPAELTSDLVRVYKMHNLSLNADDLLYESKRNDSHTTKAYDSAFSVTGTFRSKTSHIWDPHPEYTLETFGHKLHLVLHQDTSFIPPKTFRVIRILNNRTEEDEEEGHYLGCYYKGYIQGDEQSAVAVSLCNGMTGYIKTSFGSLLIQPVNQSSDDADIVHKVWRHSRRNARHAVAGDLDMDLEVLEQNIFTKLKRKKRDDEDRLTMEVLVAVDRTMIEFHKEDLKSYILTLISIVSNIYSDASIGNSIYISVANILILRDDITAARSGRRRTTSASQLLKHFCSFLSKQGYHYDTATLITRDQICRNERETKCDTLGLAELGTVCKKHSCSIVQDNGLPAAFTLAHELGHILNMPHDDDVRCKQFNRSGTKHIMSPVMGDNIHPWSWSDCSRYYVSELLEKQDKSCLEDTPTFYIKNHNTKQPGEIYSLDHQCQLIHGNQSTYCYIGEECKRLFCNADKSVASCRSSNLPWADGTPCNSNRHWCQKGECVSREGYTRQVINGGWGAWSDFTPCSLTCGGGVQESQRECNNPLPKNGGKYCTGSRKKYRSCNTQSCPPGSLDSREQQCYDMNGRNFGIKGIDRSAKWIPKYGLSHTEKCILYCRLEGKIDYFPLSDKVKDGTTCSFDSFDKCVNGICRPAGCDNELNSIAKLDKCGVCEGRNDTCEEHTGNFYVSDLYKIQPNSTSYYYYVATIPKGASNVVITQPGYHDIHYIVLRDDHRNSLLNGNHVISTYKNISYYAGIKLEYNGSNSTIEMVNTTYSRKLKRDLILEIISLGTNADKKNDSLLLTYTYTMDRSDYSEPLLEIYRWEMQEWSSCDALCHGTAYRLPVCISTTQALKVAPQFCDEGAKPKPERRTCNTECVLTLNITGISECSASCGMWGTREKHYMCIQTFTSLGRSNIVDLSYCERKFEIKEHERCREGCWNFTEWSACSKSCGTGTQTRGLACFLNGTRVTDELCDQRKRIALETARKEEMLKLCNMPQCYVPTYDETTKTSRSLINWDAGEWGECDDNCEKTRAVTCRNKYHESCPPNRKPIAKRKCCNIKYVSNWSNCSVDCGNGSRRKEHYCARVFKPEIRGAPRRRVIIDPKYCQQRGLRVPTPKRTHKPCRVSCKWSTTEWTQCPADCQEEYQSRSVYCESVLGNPITYKYCDAAKKPLSKKICNNCVRRESKIISSCNCEGWRRRRTLCYDSHRKRIACPTRERSFKEKCEPPRSCHPQSCEDVRRLQQQYTDGEYTIWVRSRAKRIYCHNMSSSPKEYITLNPTENYSIYYDYKSRSPDKCPPESRHLEYSDNSISAGRTSFRKLRVNITDLRVVEGDFTFADTSGVEQLYGSAGDCYNRNMQCPQGDFSINLERTGFHMRAGTIWDTFGNSVVMKVTQNFETSMSSRRAFCGGFCGRCAISPRTGLYLDVV